MLAFEGTIRIYMDQSVFFFGGSIIFFLKKEERGGNTNLLDM